MAFHVTSTGWLALFLVLMAAAGIVLIKIGFWPKKRGNERRCRRCDYVVENISSERCPECGSWLAGRGTVRGQAGSGMHLWLAGVLLLLVALGWGGHEVYERVDWYHYKPTRWLMQDLQIRNGVTEERAWSELIRRLRDGRMSKDWEEKLADVSLADHWAAATMPRFSGATLVDQRGEESITSLWDQYEAGKLTAAQTELFFQRLVVTRCRVRPVVLVGQDVPYSVEGERYLKPGWWLKFGVVGQDRPSGYLGGDLPSQIFGSDGLLMGAAGKLPGEKDVEIHFYAEFHRGQHVTFDPAAKAVKRAEFTTGAKVKVLDQASDEYMKVIDAPQLADQLKSCITIERFNCDSRNHFDLTLRYDNLPVNLTCAIFVRVDGKDYLVTELNMSKGSMGSANMGTPAPRDFPKPFNAKKVDLIIRSSPDLAARTVDVFEVWKGELVFKDVPLSGGGE